MSAKARPASDLDGKTAQNCPVLLITFNDCFRRMEQDPGATGCWRKRRAAEAGERKAGRAAGQNDLSPDDVDARADLHLLP